MSAATNLDDKLAKLTKEQSQDIDIKAAQLNIEGSKSQYRCMAGIKAKVENLKVKIDKVLVKKTAGPEDPVYRAVDDLKSDCKGIEDDCDE